PDPLATLDVLLHGWWREYEPSRSDGRFVAITGDGGTRYVDFGHNPPVVHEFLIPGGLPVIAAVLLEDSSGWLVSTKNDIRDRELLWRLPLESNGTLGVAELLTPLSEPTDSFLLSNPAWDISADGSTLAVGGYRSGDPSPYRMYLVNLLDPSDSPSMLGHIYQGQSYATPNRLHLTPDGGELIFHQAFQEGLASTDVWWFDIDGAPGQQLVGEDGWIAKWVNDGRTALYRRSAHPRYNLVEIGEGSVTVTPIDAPGTEKDVLWLNDGSQLMLRTDHLGGTVYMGGPFGPYEPILGGAAGEDPVFSVSMTPDLRHMFVNYRLPNDNYDVELLEVVDDVVVHVDLIAADSPSSVTWAAFDDYAVGRFSNVDQLWVLEYADPDSFTALTPILPPAASGLSQGYSAAGDYLLRSSDVDGNYYLIRTAAPGPIELVDMAPYKPWRRAVVAPYD
ncbi:MAG TPA: hypothetical protein VK034_01985, partial [Enhygromyxa sp.]|nr:hypothetical protein [Enhygromyxa sp.]